MKKYQILCIAAGVMLTFLKTQTISAIASNPDIRNISLTLAEQQENADGLIYDENGNAHFMVQNQVQTGRFSVTPDYQKGDIDGSLNIDSVDAACILYASAAAGADGRNPEDILISDYETGITAYQALQITDINGDNFINAEDAADILTYASQQGAGNVSEPLGFACYQADEDGNLQKGWIDSEHYADDNYQLHTGWAEIENQKYYFSEYGQLQKGFVEIYGKSYYFSDDTGVMATGMQNINNNIYYFNEYGVQQRGLQSIENHIYYFDADGIQQTGWQSVGGNTYYFNPDGIMLTGWQTIDDNTYYFNQEGIQQKSWQEIDENIYYFDTEGIMQSGLVTIDDKICRFQNDGIYHPRKICLDAGHYGSRYNHSPVVSSYYESNFTWDMHLHLIPALESYGFEVITTRENKETDLPLRERGQMSAGCDLFLSVHSNYDNNYALDFPLACCQVSGVTDELGLQLANTVHEVMGTRQSGKIWKRESTNEPGNDWYSVLYGAASVGTPGILLEHSFHSNLKATKWLMIDDNLERMAQAEAKVISDYFGFE